jgi:hypothetical protein
MADKKISALTGAATPLAGTEVLPIVQSGSTVKVSVSDLTTGRTVALRNANLTGGAAVINIGATADNSYHYLRTIDNDGQAIYIGNDNAAGSFFGAGAYGRVIYSEGAKPVKVFVNGAYRAEYDTSGNYKLDTGNLVIGTAGKGIDFSANTHAAGMTSELLSHYETGTWTPNQGGGLTVVGAFSSTGRYTRVGNQVTITGSLSGSGSIELVGPGIIFTNIPYAVAGPACGSMNSSSLNSSGAITAISGTTVYGNTSPAVSTIYFAMTYLV